MIHVVAVVSLALSVANWLLFVAATVIANLPRLREALRGTAPRDDAVEGGAIEPRARIDPVITATGGLATSLRAAGPAATAAALSVVFLLIAAVAAGVDRL